MQHERPEPIRSDNRPTSTGGKIFDWFTYGGLAGIGTFFLTIFTAPMFDKGNSLHGIDQAMRRGFRRLGMKESLANKATDTTNLMWGGTFMLVPIAILENYRTGIVNWLNRAFNDPTDPASVQDAPPQTIGSIIKGRLLAWSSVFVGLWGAEKAFPTTFKTFQDEFGKQLCKWLKQPETALDLKTQEMVPSRTFRFGQTGALDLFATISAATLLYVGSHFFARKAQERKISRQVAAGAQFGHGGKLADAVVAENENLPDAAAPTNRVQKIERAEERVADAPMKAVAAG